MRTRDKLAAELRTAGAMSRAHGVVYEAFALRAETGEFDDFSDTYDCPITQLYNELIAAGLVKFAKRVANGEFDATKEESDAWAASPEGQATMGLLRQPIPERLGDGPIEPEYETTMKEVARLIDVMFNGGDMGEDKKVGFILQVFPLNNHEGRCNYMSNAKREDVVIMLKEQLRRFEGQAEVTGHA
jgi:hypothetical protein